MKRFRKKYEKPKRPWDKARIEAEKELMKKYGLRRKKEVWKAEAILRKYRRIARDLLANYNAEKEKILIKKLSRFGLLSENSTLDDVLSLTVENILDRRLQTIVFKKGFANTIKQARQFIVHGHVYIKDRKITYPSYLVPLNEENEIKVGIGIKK